MELCELIIAGTLSVVVGVINGYLLDKGKELELSIILMVLLLALCLALYSGLGRAR